VACREFVVIREMLVDLARPVLVVSRAKMDSPVNQDSQGRKVNKASQFLASPVYPDWLE